MYMNFCLVIYISLVRAQRTQHNTQRTKDKLQKILIYKSFFRSLFALVYTSSGTFQIPNGRVLGDEMADGLALYFSIYEPILRLNSTLVNCNMGLLK